MDAELKKEWIDRLRSGRYDQTTGMLRNNLGFCCLGVLCEVLVDEGRLRRTELGYNFVENGSGVTEMEGTLVPALKNEFGLDIQVDDGRETMPYMIHLQERLVRMNDSEKKPFAEIADYLERLEF